jgi:hypothetical protein
MENDNELGPPPGLDPSVREEYELCQAAVERHIQRVNGKPKDAAYEESTRQMKWEIDEIIASYPSTLGTVGGK